MWIPAITDRTQNDVDYLKQLISKGFDNWTSKEKSAYNKGLKGAFNQADADRIYNNLQLLCDVLELNRTVPTLSPMPTIQQITSWLEIAQEIRNASPMLRQTTPAVPKTFNTFQDINDLEKMLDDVYTILTSNFYYYSGEPNYTGSEFLI